VAALRDEYKKDIDLVKLASELVIDAVVPGRGLRQELSRRYRLYAEGYEPPATRKHGVTPV
jgi:acetyl-CoA carboxylase carboxyltransferase component